MTQKMKSLRAKRAELLDEAEAILKKAETENRSLSEDEATEWDRLMAEADQVKTAHDREEKLWQERQVKYADPNYKPGRSSGQTEEPEPGEPRSPYFHARDRIEDDPAKGFKSPRHFLLAIMESKDKPRSQWAEGLNYLRPKAAAGADEHGEYADPHGGFLVPTAFLPRLLSVEPENDPTTGTMSIPMGAPTVEIPARVDKNHSSSVSGGLTVSRKMETVAATTSRMTLEKITIKAHSLFGAAFATEELLNDSAMSFAAIVAQGFGDEFGSKLIDEKINGTGTGEMLGVLNSAATISVAKETSQTADTINGTNIIKMRARAWRYQNAVWLANHDTYVQLVQAHIAGTNSDVFLFNPSRGVDAPDTLLGRPIFFTEYAQTLGDKGDIMLVDWSQYIVGQLAGMMQDESIHVRFLEHERAFRFSMRIGGAPWWSSALTPVNSTTTLSPYITLAERA